MSTQTKVKSQSILLTCPVVVQLIAKYCTVRVTGPLLLVAPVCSTWDKIMREGTTEQSSSPPPSSSTSPKSTTPISGTQLVWKNLIDVSLREKRPSQRNLLDRQLTSSDALVVTQSSTSSSSSAQIYYFTVDREVFRTFKQLFYRASERNLAWIVETLLKSGCDLFLRGSPYFSTDVSNSATSDNDDDDDDDDDDGDEGDGEREHDCQENEDKKNFSSSVDFCRDTNHAMQNAALAAAAAHSTTMASRNNTCKHPPGPSGKTKQLLQKAPSMRKGAMVAGSLSSSTSTKPLKQTTTTTTTNMIQINTKSTENNNNNNNNEDASPISNKGKTASCGFGEFVSASNEEDDEDGYDYETKNDKVDDNDDANKEEDDVDDDDDDESVEEFQIEAEASEPMTASFHESTCDVSAGVLMHQQQNSQLQKRSDVTRLRYMKHTDVHGDGEEDDDEAAEADDDDHRVVADGAPRGTTRENSRGVMSKDEGKTTVASLLNLPSSCDRSPLPRRPPHVEAPTRSPVVAINGSCGTNVADRATDSKTIQDHDGDDKQKVEKDNRPDIIIGGGGLISLHHVRPTSTSPNMSDVEEEEASEHLSERQGSSSRRHFLAKPDRQKNDGRSEFDNSFGCEDDDDDAVNDTTSPPRRTMMMMVTTETTAMQKAQASDAQSNRQSTNDIQCGTAADSRTSSSRLFDQSDIFGRPMMTAVGAARSTAKNTRNNNNNNNRCENRAIVDLPVATSARGGDESGRIHGAATSVIISDGATTTATHILHQQKASSMIVSRSTVNDGGTNGSGIRLSLPCSGEPSGGLFGGGSGGACGQQQQHQSTASNSVRRGNSNLMTPTSNVRPATSSSIGLQRRHLQQQQQQLVREPTASQVHSLPHIFSNDEDDEDEGNEEDGQEEQDPTLATTNSNSNNNYNHQKQRLEQQPSSTLSPTLHSSPSSSNSRRSEPTPPPTFPQQQRLQRQQQPQQHQQQQRIQLMNASITTVTSGDASERNSSMTPPNNNSFPRAGLATVDSATATGVIVAKRFSTKRRSSSSSLLLRPNANFLNVEQEEEEDETEMEIEDDDHDDVGNDVNDDTHQNEPVNTRDGDVLSLRNARQLQQQQNELKQQKSNGAPSNRSSSSAAAAAAQATTTTTMTTTEPTQIQSQGKLNPFVTTPPTAANEINANKKEPATSAIPSSTLRKSNKLFESVRLGSIQNLSCSSMGGFSSSANTAKNASLVIQQQQQQRRRRGGDNNDSNKDNNNNQRQEANRLLQQKRDLGRAVGARGRGGDGRGGGGGGNKQKKINHQQLLQLGGNSCGGNINNTNNNNNNQKRAGLSNHCGQQQQRGRFLPHGGRSFRLTDLFGGAAATGDDEKEDPLIFELVRKGFVLKKTASSTSNQDINYTNNRSIIKLLFQHDCASITQLGSGARSLAHTCCQVDDLETLQMFCEFYYQKVKPSLEKMSKRLSTTPPLPPTLAADSHTEGICDDRSGTTAGGPRRAFTSATLPSSSSSASSSNASSFCSSAGTETTKKGIEHLQQDDEQQQQQQNYSREEFFVLLFSHQALHFDTPLLEAAQHGSINCLRWMIEIAKKTGPAQLKRFLETAGTDKLGTTLLHEVAGASSKKLTSCRGVPLNPLNFASASLSSPFNSILELLKVLDDDGDADSSHDDGNSGEDNKQKIVNNNKNNHPAKKFLDGINVNAQTIFGTTPLVVLAHSLTKQLSSSSSAQTGTAAFRLQQQQQLLRRTTTNSPGSSPSVNRNRSNSGNGGSNNFEFRRPNMRTPMVTPPPPPPLPLSPSSSAISLGTFASSTAMTAVVEKMSEDERVSQVVEFLIERGADPSLQNLMGENAFSVFLSRSGDDLGEGMQMTIAALEKGIAIG